MESGHDRGTLDSLTIDVLTENTSRSDLSMNPKGFFKFRAG